MIFFSKKKKKKKKSKIIDIQNLKSNLFFLSFVRLPVMMHIPKKEREVRKKN